jgi:hypothetical protein
MLHQWCGLQMLLMQFACCSEDVSNLQVALPGRFDVQWLHAVGVWTSPLLLAGAAVQVREVVKHTPELAQLVVANGGVGALVEYCNDSAGNNR